MTVRLPSPKTKPPPVELVPWRIYRHKKLGNVIYLGQKMGCFKQVLMCQVKVVGTEIKETYLVHSRHLEPM